MNLFLETAKPLPAWLASENRGHATALKDGAADADDDDDVVMVVLCVCAGSRQRDAAAHRRREQKTSARRRTRIPQTSSRTGTLQVHYIITRRTCVPE